MSGNESFVPLEAEVLGLYHSGMSQEKIFEQIAYDRHFCRSIGVKDFPGLSDGCKISNYITNVLRKHGYVGDHSQEQPDQEPA